MDIPILPFGNLIESLISLWHLDLMMMMMMMSSTKQVVALHFETDDNNDDDSLGDDPAAFLDTNDSAPSFL